MARAPLDPLSVPPAEDTLFGGMHDFNREFDARDGGPTSPDRPLRHPFYDGTGFATEATFTPNHNLLPRDANGPQPMGTPLRSLGEYVSFHSKMVLSNSYSILELFHTNLGNPQADGPGPFGPGGPGGPRVVNGAVPIGALLHFIMNISRNNGDAVYSQEELDRVISQLVEQTGNRSTVPPASQDAIEHLPKKLADAEMLGGDGGTECSICMDAVKLDDEVTVLPCTHWFHPHCIEAWLSQHNTCPHCRRGVEPTATP